MGRRILTTLALGVGLLLVPIGPAWAVGGGATPSEGHPGDTITVWISDFPKWSETNLCWDEAGCADLGTITTGYFGYGLTFVDVPIGVAPGQYRIHVCLPRDNNPCKVHASVPFDVLEEPVPVSDPTTTSTSSTTTSTTSTTTSTTTTVPPSTTTTTRPPPTTTAPPPTTAVPPTTSAPPGTTTTTVRPTTTSVPEPASSSSTTRPSVEDRDETVAVPPAGDEGPSDPSGDGPGEAPSGDPGRAPVRSLPLEGETSFLSAAEATDPVEVGPAGGFDNFDEHRVLAWVRGTLPEGPGAFVLGPLVLLTILARAMVSAGAGLVAPLSFLASYLIMISLDRRDRTGPPWKRLAASMSAIGRP